MRALLIVATTSLALLASLPSAEAHWDRSSTDPCPPNDIRWYFDHVHRDCCTPSFACPVLVDLTALVLA